MRAGRHLRGHYLQPLLEQGLLEWIQPESPRSPTQQYRTTMLGLSVLGEAASTGRFGGAT